MRKFRKVLGTAFIALIPVVTYIWVTLTMPERYRFPETGGLGWFPEIDRWLAGPVVVGIIIALTVLAILTLVFLVWCFDNNWKEDLQFWK